MSLSKQLFSGRDITCVRGGRVLFENISFSLNSGGVLHLAGDNGCGKTSLLRIMAGVLPAYKGDLLWKKASFLENGLELHTTRFSFLPSSDSYLKSLETVLENLEFWAGLYGLDNKDCARVMRLMHITNLKDKAVRYLSAGQKRRVSIARAFLRDVPLLLLDEPLNGLDETSRELFFKAIEAHKEKGGIAVIASHYDIKADKVLKIGGKK